MILEVSTDFDQIWSIMSKVLWLNFCILLCAFDTYGECICFSLTSRRCSFLLWHFNFASHRICSEMGQVGSSSFSVAFVRKQSCCLSADTKTIVSPKKTFPGSLVWAQPGNRHIWWGPSMCFRIGHFDLSEVVALTRRRAALWLAAGAGHGGGFLLFGTFLLLCYFLIYLQVSN